MDALSSTKRENVHLVSFSTNCDQAVPSKTLVPLTITVNGRVPPWLPDLPAPSQEKNVKLVGFSITDSLNRNVGNMDDKKSTKLEEERRERIAKLMQETQEWFSQMRHENQKWRRGINDSSPVDAMKLLKEAQDRFSAGEDDLFTKFVHENQERFAELLEENGHIFTNFPRPSSMYFYSGKGGRESSNSFDTSQNEVTRTLNCTQSFSTRQSSYSHNVQNIFNHSIPSTVKCCKTNTFDDGCAKVDRSDSTSPDINLSSPTKVQFRTNKTQGAYHMTSSRSVFEYCGKTNTYRFSSEQVTQSYEQGYESISESEDEEEESDAISTTGEASEFDEGSMQDVDARSDSGCMLALEYETKKNKIDKVQQTLHKIATEILTTERTYVNILHLLDQVFAFRVDQENRAHPMFSQEIVSQMFSNLKSIYKLHHDFLLPQLEERMQNWETEQRIGDVMKNFAPFLKMYTEYVKNYDNAMNLINIWYHKQPLFAQIMDEIHTMEECGNLTLHHHMLTPVQRVPRYQLLLKDYLKKLPEDSIDRPDTEKALELVSTAASHANEAMKKIDKFKKLLEIQDMIGGVIDLVSPSRELLKEGKIIKISARSGDHQERHLFLFNDMLLLCSQRLIANRVVSGPIFRIRARLDMDGLTILEGDNLETANTFYIRNTGRSIELYTQTLEEKQDWMQLLAKAVNDLATKKSSLRVGKYDLRSPDTLELGKRAPTYTKADGISHCMCCGTAFSTFAFKRKHHCRACGILACMKCLPQKIPLSYDDNKQGRVCSHCHEIISKQLDEKLDLHEEAENHIHQKGVLEVHPSDPSVISGYLQLKARSRTWIPRWFSLHDDFVLYSFRSHEDDRALTSMPVPGYTVSLPEKGDNVDGRENVFKVFHKKKVYYFQAANNTQLQKWISALEKASRAENAS